MTSAPSAQADATAERLFLPARAGGLTFAVPAASAVAVFQLDNLTRAPGAPDHVLGVANTKYGVVAVVCLARWLDAGAPAAALGRPAMLIAWGSEIVALAVEDIDEAIAAPQADLASAPAWASPSLSARVSGVLRLGISLMPVLDFSSLFDASPESPPIAFEGVKP